MRSIKVIALPIIITLITLFSAGSGYCLTEHKKCVSCHELRGADENIRETVNSLCLGCHAANITDHKLDIVSNTAPESLPLDSQKRIICITCHEPHGKNTVGKFLRMEREKLCLSCHPA
ncbi:MAG: cytochrome c3 family protein [Proteobacteria bacterium]|nr:hypothetical protein [Desulfobulbaceae bacterium]MBU4153105.1 cytochrome c3 family protein [Pseudomonadota bacterium]